MYRDINDYEMLYVICDDDDYNLMLRKYYPLIIKVMKKYKKYLKKMGYEEEDLLQIGSLTLHQTISGYNGSENNNLFYTYFLKSLENTYLNLIRTNTTNKKRVLNESISYDNYFPNSDLTYAEVFPDEKTLNFDYLNDFGMRYYNLKYSLNFDLACVLDLKMEGFNNQEIGKLLDISIYQVVRSLKEIKSKGSSF